MKERMLATVAAGEFSRRAHQLLAEANRLCNETPDCDFDEWMQAAKRRGMTYVEGLEWAIRSCKVIL